MGSSSKVIITMGLILVIGFALASSVDNGSNIGNAIKNNKIYQSVENEVSKIFRSTKDDFIDIEF